MKGYMAVKVGIVSLGCPKNQVDAELLFGRLQQGGYELVGDAALADVAIINTCGFIESAKQESIDEILNFCTLKGEGRIKHVIITGCLAERYRDEVLKEIPEADAVVGIGCNADICGIIDRIMQGEQPVCIGPKQDLPLEGERVLTTLPYYAYLKIAEGCDNCCSYCAIPMIRGRFRSRAMEAILEEAASLARDGIKELVVVAQDTTRYGEDLYGKPMLPELLRKLCEIEGLAWIRLLYCYPERITDELLDVIASEPKVVKYLDIPIQHADADVLKAMNRTGNAEWLLGLMGKIRQKVPGITLRTTLIAGFPGETEAQFETLVDFVKEAKFERLGCFAYSQEENTPAGRMDGQLPEEVKERRAELVMLEQMRIHDTYNEQKVGMTVKVITEGYDRYGEVYFGRTEADAPDIDGKVFFSSEKKRTMGDFVEVEIDETMDYDLIGHALD
ncbi:MAG: 30S ribosomal protein S12 methylthiotransferase RimO [Oscillospiraceae bacterium]|jgi:ribosomal protein S12 methylthiotransferase